MLNSGARELVHKEIDGFQQAIGILEGEDNPCYREPIKALQERVEKLRELLELGIDPRD